MDNVVFKTVCSWFLVIFSAICASWFGRIVTFYWMLGYNVAGSFLANREEQPVHKQFGECLVATFRWYAHLVILLCTIVLLALKTKLSGVTSEVFFWPLFALLSISLLGAIGGQAHLAFVGLRKEWARKD